MITLALVLLLAITAGAHEDYKNIDTVSLPLQCVDYLGFPLPTDRFTIAVVGPDGDVVFSDSGDLSVEGMRLGHYGGLPYYCYYRAVGDIDGAGKPGLYLLVVESHNDSAGIPTSNQLPFEIVEHEDSVSFGDILDSMREGLFNDDTLPPKPRRRRMAHPDYTPPCLKPNTNYRLITLPREVDTVVCSDRLVRKCCVDGVPILFHPQPTTHSLYRINRCDTTWKEPVIRLEEIKE